MKRFTIIILKILQIPLGILAFIGGILTTPAILNSDLIDHLEYTPGEPRK
jgi:hypothetical protein